MSEVLFRRVCSLPTVPLGVRYPHLARLLAERADIPPLTLALAITAGWA